MNIEHIKSLADILSAHGLTALEVSEDGSKIRLEKQSPAAPGKTRFSASAAAVFEADTDADGSQPVDFNHLFEVKSPLVGVFYSAPGPDAEMFVSIGSKVKKGDVLCIIETMKLMNEITAERDGEIVDICVKNGDIAEFGQVLFKMY
ncbi:MAG: acetyl-CoA carboxylase biotin carboxyl carrier protein [Oscillospiraceae bacterium]|nr:acetyl-CoA carboxylase biotin carboxyl carrier protein [Oscillospiraceae bacterium]